MEFTSYIIICTHIILKNTVLKKEKIKMHRSPLVNQFKINLTYRNKRIIAISSYPSTMLGTNEKMTKHA